MTIDNLPNELLIEIFDFYLLYWQNIDHLWERDYQLEWFNLLHVCRKWRTILFASSSRLGLSLVITPRGGNMKTIMSRHFPPLPIAINYNRLYNPIMARDMGRLLWALRRPDRVRGVDLYAKTYELDKFFKATKCPFPALESLALHDEGGLLEIPITFLKGTNLHLRLRSLKLNPIYITSISRLLSSATALTDLSLAIRINQPPDMLLLLAQLQGLPYLRRLDLKTLYSTEKPTEPKEGFPLWNLTSFHYRGCSAVLNILTMGFVAPSLQDVDILLDDQSRTLPSTPVPKFINDIREHCRVVQVILERDLLHFSLLSRLECVDHHSSRFRLRSSRFFGSNIQDWIMQISNAFSAKLSTVEELFIISLYCVDKSEEVIPWCAFLEQFPCVKEFRLQGMNNLRIANALHRSDGAPNLAVLPALERLIICTDSSSVESSSKLAVFQPFVYARQQAGRLVKVSCSEKMDLSRSMMHDER